MEEAAAPLAASLRAHFSAGRPTDRPDRPEWLFGTALALARSLAPSLAPLQGAIAAHGLGAHYSAPLEYARAMRSAVQARAPAVARTAARRVQGVHTAAQPALVDSLCEGLRTSEQQKANSITGSQPLRGLHPVRMWCRGALAAGLGLGSGYSLWCHGAAPLPLAADPAWIAQGILRDHVLPRLEAMGAPALWLHLAEQAAVFERALAPLRGLPAAAAGAGDADADAPELWAPGSCLETVCANPVRRPPQSFSCDRPQARRGCLPHGSCWEGLRRCQSRSRAPAFGVPGRSAEPLCRLPELRSGAPSAASLCRGAAGGAAQAWVRVRTRARSGQLKV